MSVNEFYSFLCFSLFLSHEILKWKNVMDNPFQRQRNVFNDCCFLVRSFPLKNRNLRISTWFMVLSFWRCINIIQISWYDLFYSLHNLDFFLSVSCPGIWYFLIQLKRKRSAVKDIWIPKIFDLVLRSNKRHTIWAKWGSHLRQVKTKQWNYYIGIYFSVKYNDTI